jgi:hypothetical protein
MLIGLRFLLLFAVMAVAITFLCFLFTKNPKFLAYTKLILKITAGFVGLILLIYLVERLLFVF